MPFATTRLQLAAARALKPQCTRNQDNRRITRWEYEEVLERMQLRVNQQP